MSKKITLLGSTGSIGTQSLDVIRAQGYEVFGLSAHSHVDKILQQIEEFHPRYVCMTDPMRPAGWMRSFPVVQMRPGCW